MRISEQRRSSVMGNQNSEQFGEGVSLFNSGQYFRAHEVWEELWLASSGADKKFLQGLIQLAAAFHHHSRRNFSGAASLLKSSCAKLAQFPTAHWGIDLGSLFKNLKEWQALSEGSKRPNEPHPQIGFAGRAGKTAQEAFAIEKTRDQQSVRLSSPNARSHKTRST